MSFSEEIIAIIKINMAPYQESLLQKVTKCKVSKQNYMQNLINKYSIPLPLLIK